MTGTAHRTARPHGRARTGAGTGRSAPSGRPDRTEIDLPWWSIALPAVAFAALLLLVLNPVDAHAAEGRPAGAHVLEQLQQTVRSLQG